MTTEDLMKKKLLFYLTPAEQIVFDYLFKNVELVDVVGQTEKVKRVGLGNGRTENLIARLCAIDEIIDHVEAEDFLCVIIEEFKRAGVLRSTAKRFDCHDIGIVEVIMEKEEIIVERIVSREKIEINLAVFSVAVLDLSGRDYIASIASLIREVHPDISKVSSDWIRRILINKLKLFMIIDRKPKTRGYILRAWPAFEMYTCVKSDKSTTSKKFEPEAQQEVKQLNSENTKVLDVTGKVKERLQYWSEQRDVYTAILENLRGAKVRVQEELLAIVEAGEVIDSENYNKLCLELKEFVNDPENEKILSMVISYTNVLADLNRDVVSTEKVSDKKSESETVGIANEQNVLKTLPDGFQALTYIDRLLLSLSVRLGEGWFTGQSVYKNTVDLELTDGQLANALNALHSNRMWLDTKLLTEEQRVELGLGTQAKYLYKISSTGAERLKEIMEKLQSK